MIGGPLSDNTAAELVAEVTALLTTTV